ncbi:MAG: hypothetical protein GX896_02985 [Clostridiales bacterium]|nr:hypothetical protein [Clostridiales bacterium]
MNGCGMNGSWWIIILVLFFVCGGCGNSGFGCNNSCGCNNNSCGCDNNCNCGC